MGRERKVTIIRSFLPMKMKTRVAVYCRVSTNRGEQIQSLANQISYYRELVGHRFDWELVGIYADIRSGKNTSGRKEFKRMLDDCENHKIDMIITKSISRFGRNTVETLKIIDKLRSLFIDVYFENENIHSIDTKNTLIISIMQAIAEAQSVDRSHNIKWGILRRLEKGTSGLYNRLCFGYQKDYEGNLTIQEEEANTVRMIFDLYLEGYSILGIIRELKNQGIKSPTGLDHWSKRAIETILSNEKYIGNVLVGKTYCINFPNNKRRTSNNPGQKYICIGSHPPIISEEQFERVKVEKAKRSNIETDEMGNKQRKSTHYSMKRS